jgi:hypothetical protein
MYTLIKEHRYIVYDLRGSLILRIEELIGGVNSWPAPFRLRLAGSRTEEAKTFYGSTSEEVARQAASFLNPEARAAGAH